MNLLTNLGIKIIKKSSEKTVLSLLVSDKLKQPFGYLHGGINAVLAETAASLAANQLANPKQIAIGVSIDTHHLKTVTNGVLIAEAIPLQLGRSLQTWSVKTFLKNNAVLTSYSIVTTKLVNKR
ncbi:PaaI family thioesterase [Liquorilactobacillus sicerae]|uniref:PaaI family thioesterase n=1 Tax=Liquorilactobacillus sicerae TaxID=1416943 RepID=UPI00248054FC|nr:PaaI family thioesterase [Liquorilactobacillus sicerae]